MPTKKRPFTAFTLVELLVVIGIISVLMGILVPSLNAAKAYAKKVRCKNNLRQINIALNLYLQSNNDTYPYAQDPLPSGHWLWMGRGWRDFIKPYLTNSIDDKNPSVLWCTIDLKSQDIYESTSYSYSMSFYHSPEQINQMTSPAHTYGSVSLESIPQRPSQIKRPAEKIIVGEWLSNHMKIQDDKGWWCGEGARNYLFADGQVMFIKAADIETANDGFPNPNLTIDGIKGSDYISR
ncbi:MAG: prepilin-type N-terminal cleavage/methylation domain-containing protein [Phycisphaerae bacterium]